MSIGGGHGGFLSYQSDDVHFARSLCERLLATGIDLWFDEYAIGYEGRARYLQAIDEGVASARWGIIVDGKGYTSSPYCRRELDGLLRLDADRLFVFQVGPEATVARLAPLLSPRTFRVAAVEDAIARLEQARVIPAEKLAAHDRSDGERESVIKEIAAAIRLGPWSVEPDATWRMLTFATDNPLRMETRAFVAEIAGQSVHMFLDCQVAERGEAASFAGRMQETPGGAVRFLEDDAHDRQRLRAELEQAPQESEAARALLQEERFRAVAGSGSPTSFEFLGVHLFSSRETIREVTNRYKHRLITFRQAGHIYRIYKLALPQPQLWMPVVVRLVFCFGDDLGAFFRAVPRADDVVRSFRWLETSRTPILSEDEVHRARLRVLGAEAP